MSGYELDGDPPEVVRRAPYADNPRVGARGQRTQQRILDAALETFGEVGYHRAGISRITDLAGCNRAAFYQYFSDKEDVFRHLAGIVARQLLASAEALRGVGEGASGWEDLRSWVGRHGDIYDQYRPVFEVFPAANASDAATTSGAALVHARHVAALRVRLPGISLPRDRVDHVITLLLRTMSRARHMSAVLAAFDQGAPQRDRIDDGLTNLIHRTFCGLLPELNGRRKPPRRADDARVRSLLDGLHTAVDASRSEQSAARDALLAAAKEVMASQGYFGTRVDDITDAAGLSHGAYYHYFDDKEQIVRVLASLALRSVSESFDVLPAGGIDDASVRGWVRRHARSYSSEAAILGVWVDATSGDADARDESAAALEWGRSRIARFFGARGFGDADVDAVSMLGLLDAVGTGEQSAGELYAAATIIERGLLGPPLR